MSFTMGALRQKVSLTSTALLLLSTFATAASAAPSKNGYEVLRSNGQTADICSISRATPGLVAGIAGRRDFDGILTYMFRSCPDLALSVTNVATNSTDERNDICRFDPLPEGMASAILRSADLDEIVEYMATNCPSLLLALTDIATASTGGGGGQDDFSEGDDDDGGPGDGGPGDGGPGDGGPGDGGPGDGGPGDGGPGDGGPGDGGPGDGGPGDGGPGDGGPGDGGPGDGGPGDGGPGDGGPGDGGPGDGGPGDGGPGDGGPGGPGDGGPGDGGPGGDD